MSGATLRGLALRTLLPAFPGTTVPDWFLRLLEQGLGGVACSERTLRAPIKWPS